MVSELGRGPMLGGNEGSFGDELEKELGLLLHEQRPQEADDREKELNLYRSGSAPPTVEGSLSAVGGLFNSGGGGGDGFSEFSRNKSGNGFLSEEELRSDPAYLSYYYSNVNLNPRLPPPMISKGDWRLAQRLQGGNSDMGGIGDRRNLYRSDSGSVGRSVLSMPPGFKSKKGERVSESESERIYSSVEWGGDGLIGLPASGLAGKQKSFSEIFQDDYGRSIPASGYPSRPTSRNAFNDNNETLGSGEAELTNILSALSSTDTTQEVNVLSLSSNQNDGQRASYAHDPHLIARTPSPSLGPIGGGRASASEKRSVNSPNYFNSVSATMSGSTNLVASLSSMNLSHGVKEEDNHFPSKIEQDIDDPKNYLFSLQGGSGMKKTESGNFNMPLTSNSPRVPYSDSNRNNRTAFSPNSPYRKSYSTSSLNNEDGITSQYQHMGSANSSFSNYGLGGYSINNSNLSPLYENVATASAMAIHGMDSRISNSQNSSRIGTHMVGNALQASYVDPLYLQYTRTADYSAAHAVLSDPSLEMNYLGNSYMSTLQKAHLGTLLSPQKSQYAAPLGTKSRVPNHHGYYGTPAYGVGLSYPGSPLASPVISNSPVGPRSPMRLGMRNLAGEVVGPWQLEAGSNMEDNFASSLIEEFRNNKMKCFELSEVAGHIVEFSADQYGSRFIQQKLETATTEEKSMVFDEIIPQALTLMTDVFGNYVIQKFFEHGFTSQIRELASNLFGHVLTLSLQMYGCRVIQKAIEVVDLDQKIKMVEELEDHVMRCVRDQNGNHVIQKCIECVPEEHIQFIVSTFFDQVVILSTHPYGCRVIQRVLEHCIEPKTQNKVMDEILGSVSMLAQDQYGNYVIQHILEHGKPHERSTIIKELAGKIVQMSQQKFASNVVEKCLTFGGPAERQLLVTEMLGSTDENEPLQAMMKDQFANYVVQKVLEICDDQQRELILSRIKVHLNALKKYTYGKHIVARVEKLVVAGERRIAAQSPYPA